MVIFVMIVCVVLWVAIQSHMHKNGIEPRLRASMRYQRRLNRLLYGRNVHGQCQLHRSDQSAVMDNQTNIEARLAGMGGELKLLNNRMENITNIFAKDLESVKDGLADQQKSTNDRFTEVGKALDTKVTKTEFKPYRRAENTVAALVFLGIVTALLQLVHIPIQ